MSDFATSDSITRIVGGDAETLDSKMASGLMHILHGNSTDTDEVLDRETKSHGWDLSTSTFSDTDGTVLDLPDLLKVAPRRDTVLSFDPNRDETIIAMRKASR